MDIINAIFQLFFVVVADDVGKLGVVAAAAHSGEVIESLVFLGVFGALHSGKKRIKIHGNKRSIYHFVLCAAGVNGNAAEFDFRMGGVEGFVFHSAESVAVHGVCVVCAETLKIEFVRAAADFLVWSESDFDGSVLDFRVGKQFFRGGDDFRNTVFVVRTKKGSAVGDDYVFADAVVHFGEVLRRKDNAEFLVEHNIAALVVDDFRFYIGERNLVNHVHVSHKTDYGSLFTALGSGNFAVNIAVFAHFHI